MSNRSSNYSNYATIAASIVAIFTFIMGYYQFRETQLATYENLILQKEALEQERESKAVELFLKYNELMKEPISNKVYREKEFWRDNLAVSIAESIFKLRKEDKGWKQTVSWMLANHEAYFKKVGINCKTYDRDFIQLIKEVYNQDFCLE